MYLRGTGLSGRPLPISPAEDGGEGPALRTYPRTGARGLPSGRTPEHRRRAGAVRSLRAQQATQEVGRLTNKTPGHIIAQRIREGRGMALFRQMLKWCAAMSLEPHRNTTPFGLRLAKYGWLARPPSPPEALRHAPDTAISTTPQGGRIR
ncbi:unnamed protein product [Arctogadus glacialis]